MSSQPQLNRWLGIFMECWEGPVYNDSTNCRDLRLKSDNQTDITNLSLKQTCPNPSIRPCTPLPFPPPTAPPRVSPLPRRSVRDLVRGIALSPVSWAADYISFEKNKYSSSSFFFVRVFFCLFFARIFWFQNFRTGREGSSGNLW